MNTQEKYTLAEQVIAYALKSGAQQVSVSIDESRSNDIEIRDEQIDRLTESNRNSLTVSLYVDKKYSSNSTNRLKKDELFKFVDEAIAATRYLAEDEFRILPDPVLYYKGGGEDLNMLDSSIETIETKTKIDLAKAVLGEAFNKDERIISVSSFYSDSLSTRVLVTSNGFKGDSARSSLTLYATVAVKSDKGRPSDYWYESALFYDKLKKTDIGKKALERTLKKIGPEKISSGKYPMILENRSAPNLLYPVYNALTGYALYQKQSFLAGKKDQTIASKVMTIFDDPTIISGPGSRHFDGEGLALAKRAIVEDGVLRGYYIDTYYGRKLGMDPTSGSSTNVVFKLGDRDMEGMVKSLKKGILVTGFNGGNCNGSTGDFSYGIEGYLVENGSIIHPVNEMNITGNMTQIWNNLVEAGNDIIEGSSYRVPSLMIDNVDFSGI
ncbi:MAG: TldD/PmbA family protein [Bacteroidales bacterium]|jgi:PmbA protein|nr:TldD/PmbA family protein [Bacteroidales bacterium]